MGNLLREERERLCNDEVHELASTYICINLRIYVLCRLREVFLVIKSTFLMYLYMAREGFGVCGRHDQ